MGLKNQSRRGVTTKNAKPGVNPKSQALNPKCSRCDPDGGREWQPSPGSLLGIESLSEAQILEYLRLAQRMEAVRERGSMLLKGKRVLLLFYEASTRTRLSFELAAKTLGATTTLVTATASSIEKGESLIDTG